MQVCISCPSSKSPLSADYPHRSLGYQVPLPWGGQHGDLFANPAPSRVSVAPVMLSRTLSRAHSRQECQRSQANEGRGQLGVGWGDKDSSREPDTMLLRRRKKRHWFKSGNKKRELSGCERVGFAQTVLPLWTVRICLQGQCLLRSNYTFKVLASQCIWEATCIKSGLRWVWGMARAGQPPQILFMGTAPQGRRESMARAI